MPCIRRIRSVGVADSSRSPLYESGRRTAETDESEASRIAEWNGLYDNVMARAEAEAVVMAEEMEPDFHFKPAMELYNLVEDPGENNNLAETYPDVVALLKGRMDTWIARREKETGLPNPIENQGDCGLVVPADHPGLGE